MASLLWSDAILEEAVAIRAEAERRLAGLGIPGRLELTGATSMPGVLRRVTSTCTCGCPDLPRSRP